MGAIFMRKRTLTPSQIVDLYLSGLDSMSVGFQAGCSAGTVLNIVKAAGHTPRPRGGVKTKAVLAIPIEEAARLYLGGLAVQEVANLAGVDQMTMRKRLKDHGVKLRGHRDAMMAARRTRKSWGRAPKG
jgi:hypothetical protein